MSPFNLCSQKFVLVQVGSPGNRIQAIQAIEDVTARCRKCEDAILVRLRRLPRREADNQLVRNRDFALLVCLRSPAAAGRIPHHRQPGDNMEDPQIAPLLCVKSIRQGVTGRRSNESRMTASDNDDRDIRPAIRQLKMPTGGSTHRYRLLTWR